MIAEMLKKENVQIVESVADWKEAIHVAVQPLVDGGYVEARYIDGIIENTVNLELTEQDTALLPVGAYVYSLDWYQSGNFMCNIIPYASLRVVDKA